MRFALSDTPEYNVLCGNHFVVLVINHSVDVLLSLLSVVYACVVFKDVIQ